MIQCAFEEEVYVREDAEHGTLKKQEEASRGPDMEENGKG